MKTIATLFSGFGGVEVGAMAAGFTPIWANEIDPKIAGVYQQNIGDHIIVGDVMSLEPHHLEIPDVFHASPPCTNASMASGGTPEEQQTDIDFATKIAQFITVMQPKIFTLENVYFYRKFDSWHIICAALYENGYLPVIDHINAADFSVPQTRKRMILRAIRGSMVPHLPPPERWIGWYEAIEDLIDELPDTDFARWQLNMLPDEMRTALYGNQRCGKNRDTVHHVNAPNPAMSITTQHGARLKAFLVTGQNGSNSISYRHGRDPSFTITESQKAAHRASVGSGKVKKVSSRCLARFQSFPNSYQLPKSATLAGRGIGNAVPPMLYQKIVGQLLEVAT